MTFRAYGARSPRSHYDVILIVTSLATELATPTVMDVRTYVHTYGHLTALDVSLHCLPLKAHYWHILLYFHFLVRLTDYLKKLSRY